MGRAEQQRLILEIEGRADVEDGQAVRRDPQSTCEPLGDGGAGEDRGVGQQGGQILVVVGVTESDGVGVPQKGVELLSDVQRRRVETGRLLGASDPHHRPGGGFGERVDVDHQRSHVRGHTGLAGRDVGRTIRLDVAHRVGRLHHRSPSRRQGVEGVGRQALSQSGPDPIDQGAGPSLAAAGELLDEGVVSDQPSDHPRQTGEVGCADVGTRRRGQDVLDLVRLVEDRHIVGGKYPAPVSQVEPVEVVVDDDHVGLGRVPSGPFGEAVVAAGALARAGALAWSHRDGLPHPPGRFLLEVGPVAGVGRLGPTTQRLPSTSGETARCRRRVVDAGEVELGVGGAGLVETLETQVVGPALEHRPGQLSVGHPGHQRQVLVGQLILEGLGRGGHDRSSARFDRGHEIGQGLARSRTRRDDQMGVVLDGPGHGHGHLLLPGSLLARLEHVPRPRQRREHSFLDAHGVIVTESDPPPGYRWVFQRGGTVQP